MSPLYPFLEFVTLWRMRRIMILLFHLLVLTVPLAFSPLTDELFEFNKMVLTYLFTILIATTWVAIMISERKILFRKTILLIPLAIFLGSQLLSTIFSLDPHTSIFGYYTRFHGGLLSTISYITLCLAAINTLHRNQLQPLMRSTVLGAVAAALYALPEHFGVSPSCMLLTGTMGVDCWVQDVQNRIFGTFGQPNWLAAYLLMIVPLCLWLATEAWRSGVTFSRKTWRSVWPFLWPLFSTVLFVSVIIFTKSRSGFLGLAAEILGAIFLLFLLFVWERKQQKFSGIPKVFFSWVAAMIVTIALLGSPFSSPLQQILSPKSVPNEEELVELPVSGTVLEQGGTESGDIRRIVWRGALKVWQRYPVFGSGVETFGYSYYLDRPREHNDVSEWDFLYNKAHNEFLNALATTGLVGFGALIFLLLSFVWSWSRPLWSQHSLRKPPAQKDRTTFWSEFSLGSALILGLGGVSISNFFGFSTVMLGVITFLYPAFWEMLHAKKEDVNTPLSPKVSNLVKVAAKKNQISSRHMYSPKTSDNQNWIAYAGLGLACLFALVQVWQMWSSDVLFSQVKADLEGGEGFSAYAKVVDLTTTMPGEATYWDQRSVTMARLSLGTAETNATISGQLAFDALKASERTIELNPHQLNFWKSRVRVLLLLGVNDPQYLEQAVEALQEAQKRSPTDPKLYYNEALVWETLGGDERVEAAYQKAIELRPNYEEARNAYADFLRRTSKLEAAREQYQYVLKNLNPTAPTALEGLAAVEASLSAALATQSAQPRTGTKR